MSKKCFVVMPFGEPGTEKHRQFISVYDYIIKEAIEPLGYSCERADEIPQSGAIPEQIRKCLREAHLVVADLTDRNPNVMYEVGVRHALHLPMVLISQDLRGLPFDISHYRTIPYRPDDLQASARCRRTLADYVKNIETTIPDALSKQPELTTDQALHNLNHELRVGLENVYRVVGELVPQLERTSDAVGTISEKLKTLGDDSTIKILAERVQSLLSANQLQAQVNQLGLVGIHKNRLDAIEHYFFDVMRDEPTEMDIVGSTIFGLKGYRSVTFERIIELLQTKRNIHDFRLRILLTHWDFISYRQDQEKTEKNVARYVISKELRDAINVLDDKGLSECVKFYKGSPTCFTIICNGQKQMLMNPYPYQREAYNSWCIVVRETFGGVYSDFKKAHFDEPWSNPQLAMPYDADCQRELAKKLEEDIASARDQILGQLDRKQEYKS